MDQRIKNSAVPLPDPRYWGSRFWFTMETIAYFYSDTPSVTEMAHAKDFYTSLKTLLPCPGCAMHYAQLLDEHPVDHAIVSRMALMQWVNMIHNEVNRRLGKPVVTFEEYLMRMKHLEAPPLIRLEFLLLGVLVAVIVIGMTRHYYVNRH